MSDLISRQAAIDALIAGEPYGIEYNINKIRELPSAQPEIVRCKDCKHCIRSDSPNGWCEGNTIFVPDDWYCADGERKTE